MKMFILGVAIAIYWHVIDNLYIGFLYRLDIAVVSGLFCSTLA
jgi:hypothetical protein